jgi:hypothetical protein
MPPRYLLAPLMILAATVAEAQKLPAPTREVFRCEANGKVSYSDAPCLGAQKVNVEPTRGLNASSGRERIGADVRREQTSEAIAEAFKPLTGKDAKELATAGKRFQLPAVAQTECKLLDHTLPMAEARERGATQQTLSSRQQELLGLRQRFIALGC